MSASLHEVVRVRFEGPRFTGSALDLGALPELMHLQKLVAETAKALWRAANPDRERLPRRFEERTRLCLRAVEEGSAVVPLELRLVEAEQLSLLPGDAVEGAAEAAEAVGLLQRIFRAAQDGAALPEDCPKALLPEYARWGETLQEHETLQIITRGGETARVEVGARARLAAYAEREYEGYVDLTGRVLEADLRQNRFQVWPDEATGVTVSLSPAQEACVIEALREHRNARVHLTGRGTLSPSGRPLRVAEVESLRLCPAGEPEYDASAQPIENALAELAAGVPAEAWASLPDDLTDNLDHYIYGWPKQ